MGAADIAARGIDISSISHVIHFDVPGTPETCIHRIGRTGRAAKTGIAYSLGRAPLRGCYPVFYDYGGKPAPA